MAMIKKAKTEYMLNHFSPHEQEIIKFMCEAIGENIDNMYAGEMCALLMEYEDSEEYKMKYKIGKGNA